MEPSWQIAWVTQNSLPRGAYTYDYLHRMVVRNVVSGAGTMHRIHDLDGNVIAEYTGAGYLLTEYVWMQDRPIALVADAGTLTPQILWVHTDHQERPALMTDDSANVVWRAKYLPFGEVASLTGTAAMNYRFPGQWFQLEAGLTYNWHRHYDATTGRYVSPDPLGMPDGPSRYAYVNNTPLMSTDPEGLAKDRRHRTPCGRCTLIDDYDNQKLKHTHWDCPGKPLGCIKANGELCEKSAEPPENIKQCLRERKRVPANYRDIAAVCIGGLVLGACILAPELCIPGMIFIGGGLTAQ